MTICFGVIVKVIAENSRKEDRHTFASLASEITRRSGPGEWATDNIIYYTRTIGNCYQLLVLYNESQQQINVGLNLLAFPTQTAVFNIGQPQPVIPSTFNF